MSDDVLPGATDTTGSGATPSDAPGRRIVLGPFNRVEGDLEVSLDVAGGTVAAAYVNSPLYRGFEQILPGRATLDALAIVPRICGICSVAQSLAAVQALEALSGIVPAANGLRARNLILGAENLADHLSHFVLFFLPDFTHPAYAGRPWHGEAQRRLTALRGSATAWALPARAGLLKTMGLLAGHWPHTLGLQPGGTTRGVSASERLRLIALLADFRRALETHLFADRLEHFAALDSAAALAAWGQAQASAGVMGEAAFFLAIARDLAQTGHDLAALGRASDRFLSVGAYGGGGEGAEGDAANPAPLLASGRWSVESGVQPWSAQDIREDVHSAWLAEAPPVHPAQAETVVDADKPGAYTWCKAPRYAGEVVEVGALARQVVDGHPLARDLVARHGGSVFARVAARWLELARVVPALERWARELVPGAPFCHPADLPASGSAAGLIEAARGSLGHWITVERGRIARYQIVAPTTWNFSPRDATGTPGPLEQALVGLPAGESALPLVQHVVRSFDPCMVCTVH